MSKRIVASVLCLQALDAGIDLTAVVAAFASSSWGFWGWFLPTFWSLDWSSVVKLCGFRDLGPQAWGLGARGLGSRISGASG